MRYITIGETTMNMRNALLSMLAAGAIVPMAANAVTYYVATNGDDGEDGSSATPFATIARGVSEAMASSDGSKRVIVKSGTYKIDTAIEIGAAMTIESETGDPADVTIDGQGVTPLVKWTGNYQATLSGLTLTNGFCTTGGLTSGGVYLNGGTIRNCIIAGCRTSGSGTNPARGGGINAVAIGGVKSTPSIIDTRISGNVVSNNCASGNYKVSYGGGIYLGESGCVLRGCTVEDNVAWFYGEGATESSPTANCSMGGGIATDPYGCACEITDCIVRNNMATNASSNGQAGRGGGIAAGAGTVISNCLVYGNCASSQGGGIAVSGATITHCTITNNAVNAILGNQVCVYGGGVSLGVYSGTGSKCLNSLVEGNAISGMTTAYHNNSNIGGGGGISMTGGHNIVADCSVSRNSAHCGGAFMTYNQSAVVSNCLINGNSASIAGGVLEYLRPQGVLVTDCIITSNTANDAALSWGGETAANCSGLTFRNSFILGNANSTGDSLFYGHLNPVYVQPLVIDHCTVVSNVAKYFTVSAATTGGMTNVFVKGSVFYRNKKIAGTSNLSIGGPTGGAAVLAATTNTWYSFSENVTGLNTDSKYRNSKALTADYFVDAAAGDYRLVKGSAARDNGGPVEEWMGDGSKHGPFDMGDGTMTVVSDGGYGIGIVRNNALPRLSFLPEPGCFELCCQSYFFLLFK
jgi:hypothetical protein